MNTFTFPAGDGQYAGGKWTKETAEVRTPDTKKGTEPKPVTM